jgi:hypothetical protein
MGFDELEFFADLGDFAGEDGFETGGVQDDDLGGALGGDGVAGAASVQGV